MTGNFFRRMAATFLQLAKSADGAGEDKFPNKLKLAAADYLERAEDLDRAPSTGPAAANSSDLEDQRSEDERGAA